MDTHALGRWTLGSFQAQQPDPNSEMYEHKEYGELCSRKSKIRKQMETCKSRKLRDSCSVGSRHAQGGLEVWCAVRGFVTKDGPGGAQGPPTLPWWRLKGQDQTLQLRP